MQNEPQAMGWVKEFGIENAVELLPAFPHEKMGDVFRGAQIVVSPSIHDGTPNSLLEAMACGCFPVAGDLLIDLRVDHARAKWLALRC